MFVYQLGQHGSVFHIHSWQLLYINFSIFLYNIKSFNIFPSTQFSLDLQIELIEPWHSIQFNIEASLIDLQAWARDTQTSTLDLIF